MAVSKNMAIYVKDLLSEEEMNGARLISGEEGLDNEIKGVTIIEAPDIVKWINGGEVLLTGLYAFRSCSLEEFKGYIDELEKKKISALILKRGKPVEGAEDKVEYLIEFSRKHTIPILEVPFEVSFRDVMSRLMERLFNEEVTRLKYFKTTHDNFSALVLGSPAPSTKYSSVLVRHTSCTFSSSAQYRLTGWPVSSNSWGPMAVKMAVVSLSREP